MAKFPSVGVGRDCFAVAVWEVVAWMVVLRKRVVFGDSDILV